MSIAKIESKGASLKGAELLLKMGKNVVRLATLGAEPYTSKNGKTKTLTHLTGGNTFTGEIVAELGENELLMFKGQVYSRERASSVQASKSVGNIG